MTDKVRVVVEENPIYPKGKYKCENCGFETTRKWNLKQHMAKTHKFKYTKFHISDSGVTGMGMNEPWYGEDK